MYYIYQETYKEKTETIYLWLFLNKSYSKILSKKKKKKWGSILSIFDLQVHKIFKINVSLELFKLWYILGMLVYLFLQEGISERGNI